jgi:hypothetical protein
MAWFLIPQTLLMGWIAFSGRMTLEFFGVSTQEEDVPGRILGAILLFFAIYLIRHRQGGALPIVGNPDGNGYRFGHRMILVGNCLAASLFMFQLGWRWLSNPDVVLLLARFTDAFGYWVMALWAIGFSFLYQSMQSDQRAGADK